VPNKASGKCLVRVTSNDGDTDPLPSDVSDSVFSIIRPAAPSLEVTTPDGGEQLEVGSRFEITWNASDTRGEAVIEYSINNGQTWTEIITVTENDGEYDWTVPDTPSETCLVRVSESGGQLSDVSDVVFSISEKCRVRVTASDNNMDPKPSDMSDAVFTITLPAAPTIRVISPNGGEQLTVGSRFPIKWFGSDSRAEAKIEYSTDSGQSWTEITGSTPNDGEYDWTVPDAPSETCLIRITEIGTQSVDISDAVFSIVVEEVEE
jgi:hypothetical protein